MAKKVAASSFLVTVDEELGCCVKRLPKSIEGNLAGTQ